MACDGEGGAAPVEKVQRRPRVAKLCNSYPVRVIHMAEDERLRIIKRIHEGRQIARTKGVRMGRKPKLTPHQKTEARRRIAKGE